MNQNWYDQQEKKVEWLNKSFEIKLKYYAQYNYQTLSFNCCFTVQHEIAYKASNQTQLLV